MQQSLLPAKFQVVLLWFICSLSSLALLFAEEEPVCRFKVIPDESGQFITVQAEVKPQNTFPYLKDFGLLESIKWFIQDKEISVQSERVKDILVFSQLPTSGEARAVYKLKCITPPVCLNSNFRS